MTEVIVTSTDRVASMQHASGSVTAGVDTLLDVTLTNGKKVAAAAASAAVRSEPLVVSNSSGLHARPAAVLASRAKQFGADIRLRRGDNDVNARSVVAIMGLEIACGDRIEIVASGSDADEAVHSLSRLILDGLGEEQSPSAISEAVTAVPVVGAPRSTDPNVLAGVPA